MKNHYTIFNVENKTLTVYRKEEKLDNVFFFILILIILCALVIIIFGVYIFLVRYVVPVCILLILMHQFGVI